jgi:hypothetical protein
VRVAASRLQGLRGWRRACVFCNALAGEALPETSQRTGIMAQFSSPCHTRDLRSASPGEPGFC